MRIAESETCCALHGRQSRHIGCGMRLVTAVLAAPLPVAARTDARIAPGGYFDDLGSHGLNLFSHFFGEVAEVSGSGSNQQGLYSACDAVAASWRYRSGVTGSGSWHFGSFERADRVEITGSAGKIVFSVFEEAALQLHTADTKLHLEIANPDPIQLYHVRNMQLHLDGTARHPSCGDSAADTAWMMETILQPK